MLPWRWSLSSNELRHDRCVRIAGARGKGGEDRLAAWVNRLWAYLKYGPPVVVVSGLPRSGTSMMMQMLAAGGVPVMVDGVREADEDNPEGYWELERVKDLDKNKDKSWVKANRGKAIKVISFLLRDLPQDNRYKIIFMRRDIEEVIVSQNKMLLRRGEPTSSKDDATAREDFESHLRFVRTLFEVRSNFEVLDIGFGETIENPELAARKVARFLGRDLQIEDMAGVVDKSLYRNQRIQAMED